MASFGVDVEFGFDSGFFELGEVLDYTFSTWAGSSSAWTRKVGGTFAVTGMSGLKANCFSSMAR